MHKTYKTYRFYFLLPNGNTLYHTGSNVSRNPKHAKHYTHNDLSQQIAVIRVNFERHWATSEDFRNNKCWQDFSIEQISICHEKVPRKEFQTLTQSVRFKGNGHYCDYIL